MGSCSYNNRKSWNSNRSEDGKPEKAVPAFTQTITAMPFIYLCYFDAFIYSTNDNRVFESGESGFAFQTDGS